MNKGGRPKNPVWDSFENCNDGKSRCLHCRETVSSKSCRMMAHLSKCSKKKALSQWRSKCEISIVLYESNLHACCKDFVYQIMCDRFKDDIVVVLEEKATLRSL